MQLLKVTLLIREACQMHDFSNMDIQRMIGILRYAENEFYQHFF